MDTFTVFGHNQCGFCKQAQAVLNQKQLAFKFINIHEEGITPADLEKTIGEPVSTVPQIFHGEKYIGGYEALMAYLNDLT